MNLFISDLDGTLLNQDAQISGKSIEIINQQIENGIAFTVATARTPLSALPILEQLKINCPLILMNGALIYTSIENRFLHMVEFGETKTIFSYPQDKRTEEYITCRFG